MNNNSKKINILIVTILILASALVFSGCVCPLFSLFERSTGLNIKAGENIDESSIVDELVYPGSVVLVQVIGDIERILELVTTYGVSFSEEERQALEGLLESIIGQEVGVIVYSTPDSRTMVLSYYENLTQKGWHIEAFSGAEGGVQESDIIMAIRGEERQALVVSGTENNSFIIFIDFDWEVFEE